WNLIGRSTVAVYDPRRDDPFLLAVGDRVRFAAAGEGPGSLAGPAPARSTSPAPVPPDPEPLELLPSDPHLPALAVVAPGLLDLVVDAGRLGQGRFGLARGGPLDAPAARPAHRLVGNEPDAPLPALPPTGPVLRALAPCVVPVPGPPHAPARRAGARRRRRGRAALHEPRARGGGRAQVRPHRRRRTVVPGARRRRRVAALPRQRERRPARPGREAAARRRRARPRGCAASRGGPRLRAPRGRAARRWAVRQRDDPAPPARAAARAGGLGGADGRPVRGVGRRPGRRQAGGGAGARRRGHL